MIHHQPQWQTLQAGLQYQQITLNKVQRNLVVHAFKINLNKYQLRIVRAKDLNARSAFIKQFNQSTNSLIAINGGFFTPQMQPLGLRISNNKLLNPAKNIAWWGTFLIKNNRPFIARKLSAVNLKRVSFAIQAGPRLVMNSTIPKLKKSKIAERSALGITRDGQVIIAITNNVGVTSQEMANIMKNQLACSNALNLDGGSSSQLFAKINKFTLSVRSFRPVADAVIVKSRSPDVRAALGRG